MADIQMGNVYEVNKQIMKDQPFLTREQIEDKFDLIYDFFYNNKTYFMLLCNERKDYTLFNIMSGSQIDYAVEDVFECFENRGFLQAIELTEDKDAIEFWVKINNESYCYYLFPYDEGVLEYYE